MPSGWQEAAQVTTLLHCFEQCKEGGSVAKRGDELGGSGQTAFRTETSPKDSQQLTVSSRTDYTAARGYFFQGNLSQ